MRESLFAVAAVCALGIATACSSPGPSARPTSGGAAPVISSGGYAFPTRDAPYESILAEAGRTGRPALLFFWTSW